jgi:hypothetical protein
VGESEGDRTEPLIVKTIGSPPSENTVIVFVKAPTLFVSYVTLIDPFLPFLIGSVGFSAAVHPQLV